MAAKGKAGQGAKWAEEARDAYEATAFMRGPRHAFLRRCVPDVAERVLADVVDRAVRLPDAPALRQQPPPQLPLHSAAPFAHHAAKLRFCKTFRRQSVHHLRKQMDVGSAADVVQALMAVEDILHDPENICQIVRGRVPEVLPRFLLHIDVRVREQACRVVHSLAGDPAGREALLEEPGLVAALKARARDASHAVRYGAACALRLLVRLRLPGPADLDEVQLAPFVLALLQRERRDDVLDVHLDTLQFLLESDSTKAVCVQYDAFQVLLALVESLKGTHMVGKAKACMARLASGWEGKQEGDRIGLVTSKLLREMLCSPTPQLSSSAARLVMNLTHSVAGKKAALTANLEDPLLKLAMSWSNPTGQLFALQALSHLAEASEGHNFLRQHSSDLLALRVHDEVGDAAKTRLLKLVWRPD